MRHPSVTVIVLVAALVLSPGCGDDVRTATGGSASETRLEPEQLAGALASFSLRMEERIGKAADAIDKAGQGNDIRRQTLLWRIRTTEMVRSSLAEPNAVVALVQLWFWCAAMDVFATTGDGNTKLGAQQGLATEATKQLRTDAESIVRRMFDGERFIALKRQIDEAAQRGDLFTASGDTGRNVLNEMLSVTKLESLLAIPLSPFNALTGIGKSGDALKELSAVGDRGIDLASRYPRLLAWNLQLMLLELQSHDASRAVLTDIHSLSETMRDLGITAKELPARLRVEAAQLLEQSKTAQDTTQKTLAHAEATAIALDHAAQSLDKLTQSVEGFIAPFRQSADKPVDPLDKPVDPGRPFDITDYTAAIQAAESGAREIRVMVETLSKATKAQELDSRMQVVMGRTDTAVDKAKQDLTSLVDLIFWRCIQLAVAVAALVLVVRFARRPATSAKSP